MVRPRVRPGDRQAEPGAGDPVARDTGAREAVEERVLDLARDARARVLDGDLQPAVLAPSRSREPEHARSGTRS